MRDWAQLMRVKSLIWLASILLGVATAQQDPASDFHFSILGDRTGGAQAGVYERIWREIDLLHPDFVINVGDTIEGGQDASAAAEWAALQTLRKKYARYPWYFVAGNHDIWSALSAMLYRKETGRPPFYSFNFKNAHFTVLDNSRSEELSVEQLAFLVKDLEANRARTPKFVFFHRPFWVLYLKMGSGEFDLHRIARKYGVHSIISGHAHFFMRMERDGINYMSIGSSGASMARGLNSGLGFKEGWFYHHVWARVAGSNVEFTVKELDGPAGRGRMFNAREWTNTGPVFDITDPARAQ